MIIDLTFSRKSGSSVMESALSQFEDGKPKAACSDSSAKHYLCENQFIDLQMGHVENNHHWFSQEEMYGAKKA